MGTLNTNKKLIKWALLAFQILLVIACEEFKSTDFEATKAPVEPSISAPAEAQVSEFLPLQKKLDSFEQTEGESNLITYRFSAFSDDGTPLAKIKDKTITVKENGIPITNYQIKSNRQKNNLMNIVFVVNTSHSMLTQIDNLAKNIDNFVDSLERVKIIANLCLITNSTPTDQVCDSLKAENSNSKQLEKNRESFKNSLYELNHQSIEVRDQLTSLNIASKLVPWQAEAQKVILYVTETGLQTSPAPSADMPIRNQAYLDTSESLLKNNILTFIVGPDLPGYSSPLEGLPPLTSNENFFDIELLSVNNKRTGGTGLESIFEEIVSRLDTPFVLTYDIEDNDSNPYLPLSERKISLRLTDNSPVSFQGLPLVSSQPKGSLKRKLKWKLSRKTKKEHITVYLNDKIYTGSYRISGDEILFAQAPRARALIRVVYDKAPARETVVEKIIKIKTPQLNNYKVFVTFNEIRAKTNHYELSFSKNKKFIHLKIKDSAYEINDLYKIEKNKGMRVEFKIKKQNLEVSSL